MSSNFGIPIDDNRAVHQITAHYYFSRNHVPDYTVQCEVAFRPGLICVIARTEWPTTLAVMIGGIAETRVFFIHLFIEIRD